MSLKYFHLVFITLATLFTLGFSAWCLVTQGGAWDMVGIISAVIGFSLPVYGWFFLKKAKKLIL